MTQARKMVNLSIDETSGVDHPAHLVEGWLVMKSADPAATSAALERSLTEEATPMTVEEKLAKALERVAELEAEVAKSTEPATEAEPTEDDLRKALPEPLRKMLADAEQAATDAVAKAAEAEEALRKEREQVADDAAVAKAAADYQHLGLDPKEIGPALRRLSTVDESLAKAVETALASANAKAESADIFAEIGSGMPSGSDAYAKATAMAKAAVEQGSAPTMEQALAEVWGSSPDLYHQYLNEKGA